MIASLITKWQGQASLCVFAPAQDVDTHMQACVLVYVNEQVG
jgi:hypothetical protein